METPRQTLLLARWVCPMDRPPFGDGGVVIQGERIIAVGDRASLSRQFGDASVIDYGPAALLPGLINPHTHLELTNRPRIEFDGDIAGWLLRQRPPIDLSPEQSQLEVESATRAGIEQCLKFGVTCVGDISQQVQWTRPILSASPLRATSFGEVLGIGKLRERTPAMLERAADATFATSKLKVGISPHAPYSVETATLVACINRAKVAGLPLAMHLSEFREEEIFLRENAGPFRQLWDTLGLWERNAADDFESVHPITLAEIFFDDQSAIFAHVNYVRDSDLDVLSGGCASVVFCPRTHAYFRHPPHRWRDMLAAGINVAVGTDSCASSPDLNIVDDLRLLRRQDRSVSVELLWSLVTTRAAKAMRMEHEIGRLSAGLLADLVVFPVPGDQPLSTILDSSVEPIATWIGGQPGGTV